MKKIEAPDQSRRDVLKGTLAAAAIAPLIWNQGVMSPLRFFAPDELMLVDHLTETIIPTDNHSPGASAAKVAEYVDMVLSESPEERQQLWREGLKLADTTSVEVSGEKFSKSSEDSRVIVLTRLAGNEDRPSTVGEKFFADLKGLTVKGYYTSSIGIHREMEYKGNVYLKEYVGEDLPS